MATKLRKTEDPAIAARHCLEDSPYRMVVYVRSNRNTPLYCVAGSSMGASSAKKALKEAFTLYGADCFYCKKRVLPKDVSIDHAEPIVAGGKGELHNLLISHKACNAAKGHQAIECYDPIAGRQWLSALLAQIQDRLNRI